MEIYAQRKHRSLAVSERERRRRKVRKKVREAVFSVVKGGAGLRRFLCRTGTQLICQGRGRERGDVAEQREGEEECKDKEKKRWQVPPLRGGEGCGRN